MLGFGVLELGTIFLLVLFLFGPKELPNLARTIARIIYQMKNIFQRLEKEWKLKPESKCNYSDESVEK